MRLRFSIRDLLWLTALIAMGFGWWLDRAKLAADLSAYQQEMQIERKEMAGYIDFQRQHGNGAATNVTFEAIRKLWAEKQ